MEWILGLDAGSSSTKMIARAEDAFRSPIRIGPMETHEDFCAALKHFAADNEVPLSAFSRIAATGSRAEKIGTEVLGVPVRRVNEIESIAMGALHLSGLQRGVAVNIGTGTAFLYVEQGQMPRHLCGSGVGGGTLLGLGARLLNTDDYKTIADMALRGERNHADISIADLDLADVSSLDPRMTLSNFGKLRPGDGVGDCDIAAALVNLILQTIGTETVLACRSVNCDTAILTGSLTELPRAREMFGLFTTLYGITFRETELPAFATAVGTVLL